MSLPNCAELLLVDAAIEHVLGAALSGGVGEHAVDVEGVGVRSHGGSEPLDLQRLETLVPSLQPSVSGVHDADAGGLAPGGETAVVGGFNGVFFVVRLVAGVGLDGRAERCKTAGPASVDADVKVVVRGGRGGGRGGGGGYGLDSWGGWRGLGVVGG